MQRAVLARELGEGVEVLIAANPCFGLDFKAVAEIRSQIMQARNRGAAVLLVSEDLDEILELADRVLVISGGKIVYETPIQDADRQVIGRHMAGINPVRQPCRRKVTGRTGHSTSVHWRGDADMPTIAAQPYDYTFEPERAGAGHHRHAARLHRAGRLRRGAGQRRAACWRRPSRRGPTARRLPRAGADGRSHQGMPPARPVRLPAGQAQPRATARCGSAIPGRWAASSSTASRATISSPPLRPRPGEVVIAKPGKGAFYATPLHEELQGRGITHLLFTGVTTEVCVQTTMREANDRGYECLLVEDGTESYFPEFKQGDPGDGPRQGGIVGWTATTDASSGGVGTSNTESLITLYCILNCLVTCI